MATIVRAVLCAIALALPGAALASDPQLSKTNSDPRTPPPALALSIQPSPARGDARIAWAPAGFAPVAIVLVDVRGHVVRHLSAGTHESSLRWDGLDDRGREARPGVYLVQLDAGGISRRTRLVFLR